MTTAHRPTWTAAVAGSGSRGNWSTGGVSMQFSAKDQTSQTKLKFRQLGQNSEADLATKDRREALAEGEARAKGVKTGKGGERSSETASAALLLTNGADILLERAKRFDDHDECGGVFSDSSNDGGDDDDSEDEEEALQRELEKIKTEREVVRLTQERDAAHRELESKRDEALTSNELLNPASSSQIKRRWNDDVIFKGQARTEPAKKKRFINDTIRSDFHKAFLSKYCR